MSPRGDTLLTCSQDLHAENIVFALPGLAELTVQVWMRKLEDPDLILSKYANARRCTQIQSNLS